MKNEDENGKCHHMLSFLDTTISTAKYQEIASLTASKAFDKRTQYQECSHLILALLEPKDSKLLIKHVISLKDEDK